MKNSSRHYFKASVIYRCNSIAKRLQLPRFYTDPSICSFVLCIHRVVRLEPIHFMYSLCSLIFHIITCCLSWVQRNTSAMKLEYGSYFSLIYNIMSINPLNFRDTLICCGVSPLDWVMAWHLLGAKPLPKTMMNYLPLDTHYKTSLKIFFLKMYFQMFGERSLVLIQASLY